MKTKELVKSLNANLRDKSGSKDSDFLNHYCNVLQDYAYATVDHSWNQLEKQLTHVLGMLIYHRRFLQIAGFVDSDGESVDPRDFVQEYEDTLEQSQIDKQKDRDEWLRGIINSI